ncbi:DUF4254 domain-containing protein [Nocardia jejuensis]|uniref:DUF4254 domain-containing protein n=1 Tax=Nocardia jejuensis TaxID=328049 RepID=UPI00082DD75B|nr:DUF4254 domain-containing protein [Nocardia jejuensis]
MAMQLPSKDLLLEACAGCVSLSHPVLEAAYELTGLHEARRVAEGPVLVDIDCARDQLVRDIDRWVAREMPRPYAAASLHTETLGMVVDRMARFSVDAYAALLTAEAECRLHTAWKCLAELALAYADLSHDLTMRTRRFPDYPAPRPSDS